MAPEDLSDTPATDSPGAAQAQLFRIGLLVLLVLGFVLRVASLPGEALDGDELYTLEFAAAPLAENIASLLDDGAHPPLHYLASAASVAAFGMRPLATRILSVIAGLLALTLVSAAIFRWTGRALPALAGGMLIALSAEAVYFSQEGRSYAIYALLVLAMLIVWHRAVDGPESERRSAWIAFGALAFAALMTHYIAALYVLALGVALFAFPKSLHNLRRWALSVAPGGIALTLWLLAVRRTAQRFDHDIAVSIQWRGVPEFAALTELVARLVGLPLVNGGTTVALLVVLLVSGWIASRVVGSRDERQIRMLVSTVVVAGLPPALLFLAAQPPLAAPVWSNRHLFPSQALLVLFFSLGLWWAARGKQRWFFAGVGSLAALAIAALVTTPTPRRVPANKIAEYIAERDIVNPGSPVLSTEFEWIGRSVQYYLGSRLSVEAMGAHEPLSDHFWLIHRETSVPTAVVDSLRGAGWTALSEERFGADLGTSVWELRR